jgi:hypothetical protein
MEGTSHKKRGESICAQGFSPGFFFFILHIVFLFSSSFLETHLFYFNANNFLTKYCANIEPKTNFFLAIFHLVEKFTFFYPDRNWIFSNVFPTFTVHTQESLMPEGKSR